MLLRALIVGEDPLKSAGIRNEARERHLNYAGRVGAIGVQHLRDGLLAVGRYIGIGGNAVHVRVTDGMQAGA